MTTQHEILELTQKLITFKTTSNDDLSIDHCLDFIVDYFNESNVYIKRFQRQDTRPCLVITLKRTKKPIVFFNGHIDVVEGDDSLFKSKIKDGKLTGRGSNDMKSEVAAFMVLMKDLAKLDNPPSVGLMVVSDEEIAGEEGTSFLLKKRGYSCKFAITGEPTMFNVEVKHKTLCFIKIIVKGKSAHSSRPWLGENAIENLVHVYNELKKKFNKISRSRKWNHSCVMTNVKAIGDPNVIPSLAEALLDIRLTEKSDPNKVLQLIKELGGEGEILATKPMLFTEETNEYVQSLRNISQEHLSKRVKFTRSCGSSDTHHFSDIGIPAVNFGITGGHHHTDKEYVRYKLFHKYYDILKEFVEKHC